MKKKPTFGEERGIAARHRMTRAAILEIHRHGPRYRAVMAQPIPEEEKRRLLQLVQELQEEAQCL